MAGPPLLRWRFGQCFGEKDADEDFSEADILSAVEFDETGDYLATGDKGGRIVVFERADAGKGRKRPHVAVWPLDGGGGSSSGGAGSGSSAWSGSRSGSGAGGGGFSPGGRRGPGGGMEEEADRNGDRDGSAGGGGALAGGGPGGGAGGAGAGAPGGGSSDGIEYRFYTEFQSHEAEFDYLKSVEIEEKINKIAWAKRCNGSLFLLSTNDKTIKLWKVSERRLRSVTDMNVEVGRYGGRMPVTSLRVPSLHVSPERTVVATPRRVYGNAHAYHVNSIGVNSDGATFLSADDLRVNVWDMENAKLSFNVLDIKPPTLEELTEVITAAKFHPLACHLFMYSSSRGAIKLGDMRAAALCDHHAKVFEEEEEPSSKSYYSEIIASVSDIDFTSDGRYIVARDYMSIKVWDLHMEARPLRVIPVHEYLRPKLAELYESDCIFDKFEVAASGDGRQLLTGSYNSCFKIYDTLHHTETTIELAKARPRIPTLRTIPVGPPVGLWSPPRPGGAGSAAGGSTPGMSLSGGSGLSGSSGDFSMLGSDISGSGGFLPLMGAGGGGGVGGAPGAGSVAAAIAGAGSFGPGTAGGAMGMGGGLLLGGADPPPAVSPYGAPPALPPQPPINPDELDYARKVLYFSWHPFEDCVAVAGLNNLYIYTAGS